MWERSGGRPRCAAPTKESGNSRWSPSSAPFGGTCPTPFGLRPFPPRQGESAPWKGEGLRTTARVAPTALREPCLESGGRVRTPAPTANLEASLLFVGAGHWPARRCTRRVQEAVPYSPAPVATCSAKPGAVVKAHHLKFSVQQAAEGGPQRKAQRSGFALERRSDGVSELCPVRAERGIRNPRRRSGPAGI